MKHPPELLLTCEHAGNSVPDEYLHLFAGRDRLLATHRGYDRGTAEISQYLADQLQVPLLYATTTRLLVDLNRSLNHPQLLSPITSTLDKSARERLLAQHYHPYRQRVLEWIRRQVAQRRPVLHVSVHSFTPVRRGQVRRADIGLLYDPARRWERSVSHRWQRLLRATAPSLVVRRNYPYRGAADGHTTALRRRFADRWYAGIELEVNQRWVLRPGWEKFKHQIFTTLAALIGSMRR